ncbi:MAG: GGDEF domain-containing protein [bacterium]
MDIKIFGNEKLQNDYLLGIDFAKVFSSFSKPVIIKDMKGDIIYLNERANNLRLSTNDDICISFDEDLPDEIKEINKNGLISINKVINTTSSHSASQKKFFQIETITLFNNFGLFYGTLFIFFDKTETAKNIIKFSSCNSYKIYDELTGFLLKSQFDEIAEKEAERCKRYGVTFSVAYFSFENLALIGQAYGQEKLNKLIKYYGMFLNQKFRKTDCLFRFDFNDFFAILTHTSLDVAVVKFEKIKKSISEAVKFNGNGSLQPVLYYGISEFDIKRHFKNWNLLIDEARLEFKKNKTFSFRKF